MAGFIIPQSGALVLSKGRPATPVVDIALINGVAAAPTEPLAVFIPPRPVVPSDFEMPSGRTFRALVPMVVETTNLSALVIMSPRRSHNLVKARFTLMWLSRRFTKLSTTDIGRRIGNRDHSTVISACRRVDAIIAHLRVPVCDCPRTMAERLWSLDWPRASAC